MKYRISGALFALAIVSWATLLWHHFDTHPILLLLAILVSCVATMIEIFNTL